MRKAAIIGVGLTKIGLHPDITPDEITFNVVKQAMEDAHITGKDIDGMFMTPEGFAIANAKIRAGRLAEYFQISPKSMFAIECGGITSGLALKHAVNEIILGNNDINIVFGCELAEHERPEDIRTIIGTAIYGQIGMYGPWDGPYGLGGPLPYYAMSTQRYMYEYGVTAEQIAKLPVILRKNASKNQNAHFREEITVEDVLSSRIVSPPIHFLECCPWSEGAAAIVLASEERAKKLSKKPVYITGIGEYHDSSHFASYQKDLSSFISVEKAAQIAYHNAKRKAEEIDLAEVYGVFAGTSMMIYEGLGFFKKGEAAKAVGKGSTEINGEIPIDPSGGRLSFGHPAYATPLLEAIEIVFQLREDAGDRQVKGANIGLVHAEHGMLNGSVVIILEI